jgi:myo-inositol-1(or 4)-monophosphatase
VVTDADYAAEGRILEILSDTPEPYNIISEEAGHLDHGSAFTWVVDPLDGTSNFAARLPWYGVIITLFRDQAPVLGGMYLPAEDQLYMAESGKGAWRNGHPIRVRTSENLAEQLISYSFDFSSEEGKTLREMQLMARLSAQVRNIRSTNSLYDFCYVADGRLGAALNRTTRIWDIAAAGLMVKEAGGVVTDMEGNEIEFDLTPGSFQRNYTILAAGKGVHDTLMKTVHSSRPT